MGRGIYNLTIITFVFSICISCGQQSNRNSNFSTTKPVENPNIQHIDRSLLNGIWFEGDTENANFYIMGDSMHLVEDPIPCLIKLSGDTLITYYNGLTTYDKIIKLDIDSLVLLNELGDQIRLKRKKKSE